MLPEQGQFRTNSAAQLTEDLQREHRAVREEFRLAGKFFAPAPVTVYPTTTTYQANPWESVVLVASCTVLLPQLPAEAAGVMITIIRRAGTATVKSDTAARVQNGTTDAITSVRRTVYEFEGQDWWRG